MNISMTNDNIVEGDEMFTMNLNVPVSPGIIAGALTMATATIIDTSSRFHNKQGIRVVTVITI